MLRGDSGGDAPRSGDSETALGQASHSWRPLLLGASPCRRRDRPPVLPKESSVTSAEQGPRRFPGFPRAQHILHGKRKTEKARYPGLWVPKATSVLPLGQTKSSLTPGGRGRGPELQAPRLEEATGQASIANAACDMQQPELVQLRPLMRPGMVPFSRPLKSSIFEAALW